MKNRLEHATNVTCNSFQRNMTKALHMNTIDNSSGIMFPFYDSDNNVMFLAGKVCIWCI